MFKLLLLFKKRRSLLCSYLKYQPLDKKGEGYLTRVFMTLNYHCGKAPRPFHVPKTLSNAKKYKRTCPPKWYWNTICLVLAHGLLLFPAYLHTVEIVASQSKATIAGWQTCRVWLNTCQGIQKAPNFPEGVRLSIAGQLTICAISVV